MRANIGDQLVVHSHAVGLREQTAEIIEVRGDNGAPPYVVRFEDGHESLVFPGPDSVVRHEG